MGCGQVEEVERQDLQDFWGLLDLQDLLGYKDLLDLGDLLNLLDLQDFQDQQALHDLRGSTGFARLCGPRQHKQTSSDPALAAYAE